MRWKAIAVIGLMVALVAAWGQESRPAKAGPTVPAQPDREIYGLLDLALFQNFQTAEDYQAQFGVAAPAWNAAYRPKSWFDSTVDLKDPEADVCYLVARLVQGQPKAVQSCMPAWEAARVNIPSGEASPDPNDPRARPPRDHPIRPLLPNEVLIYTVAGIQVLRIDKRLERDKADGKFLPNDRSLLEAIARKLGVQ